MRGRLLVWEIVVVPSYFVYTYMCTLFGRGGVLISRVKLKHSSYVRMHVSALRSYSICIVSCVILISFLINFLLYFLSTFHIKCMIYVQNDLHSFG